MSGEQHVPASDAMQPRVPLDDISTRVLVPMVPFGPAGIAEQAATADYFDGAAQRIAGGFPIGGYNVTSTVIALLHRTAEALRSPEVRALPDRETIARALHDATTAKARSERANVATWDQISAFHRNGFLAMADAVLALFGQEGQR